MALSPVSPPAKIKLPVVHRPSVGYRSWLGTFKEVMTRGITPLWIAGICMIATGALFAAALSHPVDMNPSASGESTPGSAAAAGSPNTLEPAVTNNQEDANMQSQSESQSQSSSTHASVNSDNTGTTITVNGQTETVPAGQSVDRSMSFDQNGTHTEVHISSQSSGGDGNTDSSNQFNVNVQSRSTAEGGTQ